MGIAEIGRRGIVLLGCGRMGTALMEGWLRRGLSADALSVIEPHPGPRLAELEAQGLRLNAPLPEAPALCLVAVKPQMMAGALAQVAPLGRGRTVFLSIAAGTPIRFFESILGAPTPVVRAMPNTPAAVGHGISAIAGNAAAGAEALAMAEDLLSAVGEVVRLESESQMDAVTAVSGSGPAYVFHLIEAMAEAGAAEGLPPELALRLARATVAGAGALAMDTGESPETLRINVTSPGGTTAAALEVLMDADAGLRPLLRRAVRAAADRARELAR